MTAHPTCPLSIVIVGCGLGGLAAAHSLANAGHRVTVFEADTTAGEIGAGLQVSPNVSRILRKWGFRHELEQVVVSPSAATWRRCVFHVALSDGSLTIDCLRQHWRAHRLHLYKGHRGRERNPVL
jgi:2-polyprenyl-6-methoxyphenol hydroxylase-like FAD-dependent oxidoreductase